MNNEQKHLSHKFYQDVHTFREEMRKAQIIKGSKKYPEPFTTSSWTNEELVEHAMQENVDQAHYIYACKERMDELSKNIDDYKKAEALNLAKLKKQDKLIERYEKALKSIYNWETRTEVNKTVHLSESAILAKQALEGEK